ncbi:MAG TPA: site-specific tyrosine recombinase [Phycisphaerae bacterium]|nr:site-specific tyrosine recombinase [Phycisphaerae bacterium]
MPDDSRFTVCPRSSSTVSASTAAVTSTASLPSPVRLPPLSGSSRPPDFVHVGAFNRVDASAPAASAHVDWRRQLIHFTEYLISECGLARNTIDAYRRDLLEFVGLLDDRDICSPAAVTILIIQSHLVRLTERKLALSSIARHLVSVRMFLRYLFITGVMKDDLTAQIETPRKWQRLPGTLNRSQTEAMLAAPQPGEPFYSRDRAILELLYATGMRVSELASLKLRDLNLTVGFLRCLGKGRKERVIPVGSAAIEALQVYLSGLRAVLTEAAGDEQHVFVSRTGRRMDRTNIWRLVSRCAAIAGISVPVGPHTLRHCFATHVLEGGADLRIVQELLGHATVATTQIYTHVDTSRLKGIHSRFHPHQ